MTTKHQTKLNSSFIELIRDIFNAITCNESKMAKKSISLSFVLGEVDDPETSKKFDELKALEKDKVVSKLTVTNTDEDFLDEDDALVTLYVTSVAFNLSLTKFKKLVQEYSLYPRFIIQFNEKYGIIFNDKFTLRTPQDAGTNFYFWEYILKYQNRRVAKNKIEKYVSERTSKKQGSFHFDIPKLVNRYGFVLPFRKLFFPMLSRNGLYFRNPVFQRDVEKEGVSEKAIEQWLGKMVKNAPKHHNPTVSQSFLNTLIVSQKISNM